jgi:DNA repair protein RadC
MTNSAVTKTAVTKNSMTLTKSAAENTVRSIAKSRAAASSADVSAKTKARKRKTTRPLKKHFQYIIPQYRLILVKEPGIKPTQITDALAFHNFIQPLTLYSEEHFIAFHLDAKYQVIGYHEVSKGTLNASLVHPREVFKAALLSNAYAIIVAHNHPSGSVSASPEDIDITKQLIKAGKIMGVCIVDHCIVSSEGINSLRETESHLWGE